MLAFVSTQAPERSHGRRKEKTVKPPSAKCLAPKPSFSFLPAWQQGTRGGTKKIAELGRKCQLPSSQGKFKTLSRMELSTSTKAEQAAAGSAFHPPSLYAVLLMLCASLLILTDCSAAYAAFQSRPFTSTDKNSAVYCQEYFQSYVKK